MLIVSKIWYPVLVANDLGQRFLEMLKELPEDRTLGKTVIRCVKAEKEGLHTLTIYAPKDDKIKEMSDLVTKRMMFLGNGIQGFQYSVDMYYSIDEAMPLLGLEMPQ